MRVKYQSLLSLLLGVVMLFSLGGEAFADTLTLPAELQTIEEEAFYGDTSLDEVVIPEGTTTIGQRAFADSGLKRIDIPDTVTEIADNAFNGTEELTIHAMPHTYAADFAKKHSIHWEHDAIEYTVLGLNQQATGTITANNTYVYYAFTPENAGRFNFQCEADGESILMVLFNADWRKKYEDLGAKAFGNAELSAGETCYVGVSFADESNTGDIRITVSESVDVGFTAAQDAEGYERYEDWMPGTKYYFVPVGGQFTAVIDAVVEQGELHYEWYVDDTRAEGQTGSTYTVQADRFHNITGRVYDDFGSCIEYVYSVYPETKLTVNAKNDQNSIAVLPGGSATMAVEASCNLEPLTYQWYRMQRKSDNEFGYVEYYHFKINGATEPSYTVQGVNEPCNYWCEVTDPLGNAQGVQFRLSVDTHFSAQNRNGSTWQSISANFGDPVEMSVIASSDAELSYQWYKSLYSINIDGYRIQKEPVLIEGATDSTYTASADCSATYHCIVCDTYGNMQYVWFDLTINTGLTAYAKDGYDLKRVNLGETVKLEVEASCNAELSYQWYDCFRNYDDEGYLSTTSKRIDGATESSYTVDAVSTSKNYLCIVSDAYGNSRDVSFSLQIESHLEAHAKDNVNSFSVAAGEPVELIVEASCDEEPLSYQWYERVSYINNEGNEYNTTRRLRGATESSYSTGDNYKNKHYFCIVKDIYGNSYSEGFDIQIESHFEAHAKDNQTSLQLNYGQSAVLAVEASCDAALQYQWFELVRVYDNNGYSYSTTRRINGATDSSYTTESKSVTTEYYCRVNDPYGNKQDVWFYLQINTNLEAHAKDDQASFNLDYNQTAELAVEASCDVPLTYQWYEKVRVYNTATSWYYRTTQITGATDSSYTREVNSPATEYYCRVSDQLGNMQDVHFYLQLNTHLQVHAKDDRDRISVTPGDSVEMTVEASCDTEFTYQWSEAVPHTDTDGNQYVTLAPIDGATGSSYTADSVNENTDYACQVRDDYGNMQTAWFYLSVDQGNA